jgi:enoyl-CoA hydratase
MREAIMRELTTAPGLTAVVDESVCVIKLDRPHAANTIDAAMHDALPELWRRCSADPDIRAIVFTGAGHVFCGGGDLAWIAGMIDDESLQESGIDGDQEIIAAMLACPVPIIAAVNGPAVGLGCSLAVMCDLVLIADDTYLLDPHVTIGLVAGDGGAAMFPVLAPMMRAKQFLFTGDRISAADAVQFGLAIGTYPRSTILDEAVALARRIAKQPADALRETKRAINLHLHRTISEVLEVASKAERESLRSEEFANSIRALLDAATPQRSER